MKKGKLSRIIVSLAVLGTLMTSTIASGAFINTSSINAEIKTKLSDDSEEGVLKVDIDNKGNVVYQEPVSAKSVSGIPTDDEELYGANKNRVFSWDNATVYFVLTDRFLNSDKSNDHSYGRGLQADGKTPMVGIEDPTSNPGTFHGGDLNGLTQKVEEGYFSDLGINAIWITAPYEQIHGFTSGHSKGDDGQEGEGGGFPYYSYHGYWALDFSQIDANMGTEEDFASFVDAAHEKGIRVVMDVVMNHVGYSTMKDADEYGFGAVKPGWKEYYFGPVDNLSGGKPESINWWDPTSDNWSKWWGPGFVRANYPGYTPTTDGAGLTNSLSGLPDIITEGKGAIGTPPLLVNKWTKEGRLAKEEAELKDFFKNSGLESTARNHVIKWLTDWVREYGVDGYRCDTAKHVELEAWGELYKQSDIALKEWRKNNPEKAGADWEEDFWMTGEEWGRGVGYDAYYSIGQFTSMINFTFPKGITGAGMEGTYARYAADINSREGFNVLSYLSAHDDTSAFALGTAAGGKTSAASLLLAPGGVQVFYGEEVNRKLQWEQFCANNYKDQILRSSMPWGSIDKDTLAHWQKIGQFRNNHPAVGAGEHQMLSQEPYAFVRTYAGGGMTDKVVCAMGVSGTVDIPVSGAFSDGAKLRDYYTGEMYTVKSGVVTVKADANGIVLLEKGDNSPDVGVSPGSKTFYTENLELTLSVSKDTDATYSIDGGKEVGFTNGEKVTIGDNMEYGDSTEITVYAENSDGTAGPSTYTYTKEDPASKMIKVHYKNKDVTTAPKIYVYGDDAEETQYSGVWPGKVMTDDGDGWFSFEYIGESSGKVIFSTTLGQDPAGAQVPGYSVTGEMKYEDGKWSTVEATTKPKINSFEASSEKVEIGEAVSFIAEGSGGTGDLSYEFMIDDKVIKGDGNTLEWTPKEAGTYVFKVTAKDEDNKKSSAAKVTIKVTDPSTEEPEEPKDPEDVVELKVNSLTSNLTSPQKINTKITFTAKATGGSEDEDTTYIFEVDGKVVRTEKTSNTYSWTPKKEGTYKVKVIANNGDEVAEKEISYVISEEEPEVPGDVEELKISKFTVSNESIKLGESTKLSAEGAGGSGELNYEFIARNSSNKEIVIQKSSSLKTVEYTPTKVGTYKVYVVVTDEEGNEVESAEKVVTVSKKDDEDGPSDTSDNKSMLPILIVVSLSSMYIITSKVRRKN